MQQQPSSCQEEVSVDLKYFSTLYLTESCSDLAVLPSRAEDRDPFFPPICPHILYAELQRSLLSRA